MYALWGYVTRQAAPAAGPAWAVRDELYALWGYVTRQPAPVVGPAWPVGDELYALSGYVTRQAGPPAAPDPGRAAPTPARRPLAPPAARTAGRLAGRPPAPSPAGRPPAASPAARRPPRRPPAGPGPAPPRLVGRPPAPPAPPARPPGELPTWWQTDAPVAPLFDDVIGQPGAVAALTAAARRPVHAYLLVGPPSTGKFKAAVAFAASLLCPSWPDPDGTCDSCRRVLAGVHPDLVHVEREGPYITMEAAREITRLAAMSPVEGGRKVIVLEDFHLVHDAGPALLKTIEEPPASTVFVILAEHVPPDLVTIASRCVRIDFDPLTTAEVTRALEADGVEPERAARLAAAAPGRLDRARLLAADHDFDGRQQAWRRVPARLDGTGATAAATADELIGLLDASVEPLKARQAAERAELEQRNARAAEISGSGKGGRSGARAVKTALNAGITELETRQRRELRRQRIDELRAGLAALAGAYRDRLAATDARRRSVTVESIDLIDELGRDLVEYNPGELLALQALFSRLGQLALRG